MSDYKVFVTDIIRDFKNNYYTDKVKYSIPLMHNDVVVGRLRPVPTEFKEDALNDVHLQTKWRNIHKDSFLVEPFTATDERTLNWLKETYDNNDDRIIFMILDAIDNPIGHLAYENFIYEEKKAEYGRLMRGEVSKLEKNGKYNLIEIAQIAFLNWGFNYLDLSSVYGTQFADNFTVNILHAKCGFKTINQYDHQKSSGTVRMAERELKKTDFKLLNK